MTGNGMTGGGTASCSTRLFGAAAILVLGVLTALPATGLEKATVEREQILRTVRKAASVEPLESFLTSGDDTVRRAAVRRLGELGTPEAVPPLLKAFDAEPRLTGADVPPGLRSDILDALVQSGTEGAEGIRRILRDWRSEGPRHEGDYAHIYDSQYFAVLHRGVQSLERFPSEETKTFFRSIESDPETFYTIREEAARSLLRMEIKERSPASVTDRTAFLLDRIDPEGVLLETGWSGPGRKTAAAVRQAAVEELLGELGTGTVEPALAALESGAGEDPRRRLALARIVMNAAAGDGGDALPPPLRSRVLAASMTVLEDIPEGDARSSPTVTGVYRTMVGVADEAADKELWGRLKTLSEGISLPGAWKGPAPTQIDLWVEVPEDSLFLAGRSRKVPTPHGDLVTAWFLHDDPPEKIVAFFGEQMEREPRTESGEGDGTYEKRHVFDLPLPPVEISRLLQRGVTVFESAGGFEERAFGETTASGQTLFRVIR